LKYYVLRRTPTILDSIKKKHVISRACCFVVLSIIIEFDDWLCVPNFGFTKRYVLFIDHLAYFFMIPVIAMTISALLSALQDYYKNINQQNNQIYGYIPIFKFAAWLFSVLLYVSVIFSQSIFSILTSLGAVSAIIVLIFKDTIAGLMVSFQNTSNQNVRIGDWIVIPNNNVEGVVDKISITTIKIRNFDNTFTILPITMLNQVAVKNKKYFDLSENVKKMVIVFNVNTESVVNIDEQFLQQKSQYYDCSKITAVISKTNLLAWTDYVNYFLMTTNLLQCNVAGSDISFLRYTKSENFLITLELVLYVDIATFDRTVAQIVNHIAVSANDFGVKIIHEKRNAN
jgi:miniconductance mechanosensitive channel